VTLVRKFLPMECDVIVVDGVWGAGKTAVISVIGDMPGVEKVKLELVHEHLCILEHLGRIKPDGASYMHNVFADMNQYHNLIGREVNFRPSDATGTRNTLGSTARYLRRMFGPAGDDTVSRINAENLAYHVVSHHVLPVVAPLHRTFGDRLRLVEIVRHPVHLVRYWNDYLVDLGRHREFTLSVDVGGEKIPWWATDWADTYQAANTMDRAIRSIHWLYESIYRALDEHHPHVLALSFEDVVMRPESTFARLSSFLGRPLGPRAKRIMRREKIPRTSVTRGRAFSTHNWATVGEVEEAEVYRRELDYVHERASSEGIDLFHRCVEAYGLRFPSELDPLHVRS